jgi:hypothetical protein
MNGANTTREDAASVSPNIQTLLKHLCGTADPVRASAAFPVDTSPARDAALALPPV